MNHLAHLFLAGDTAESLIGNLAGDFVKGALRDRFPPGIERGIRQHRAIDAFTDSHPAAAAFRRVLIPGHRHYARVIADLFFDHFLALRFEEYGHEPLESFLARTYATIDPHAPLLPGRLRLVYPHMRDEGWLTSYRSIASIHRALTHMSGRFSRNPELASSTRHLTDSRGELEGYFEQLFPDVMAFSEQWGATP